MKTNFEVSQLQSRFYVFFGGIIEDVRGNEFRFLNSNQWGRVEIP